MATSTRVAQFKNLTKGTTVLLPSGFDVLARRIDIRTLMKTGRIPNSLRPILDKAMQGEGTEAESISASVLEDPTKLEDMFTFIDQIWIDCVVDPPSAPNPAEGEVDDENIVYPKDVPDEDKMFLMNWAMGGSKDIERFREESLGDVRRVHDVTGDADSALPPPSLAGPV